MIGLVLIIAGSAFAGMQDTVGGIVAFRALWGLGNALFIATALSTIVSAASGSVGQAIILYEAALGVGIAAGPLLGGWLGGMSWRAPFFGVAVLMVLAVIATAVTLPPTPRAERPSSILAPIRALGHRGLLTVGITALLYNFGFFTLLAFTPFPLNMSAQEIGFIFFGWGVLLALTSVFVAPALQRRVGTLPGLVGFAAVLAVMGFGAHTKAVLVVGVILAGAFLGINNTLVTETVMKVSPVERPVASAAYSFVRFGGGAVAPWLAGTLGERSIQLPFWVGAGAVLLGVVVLLTAAPLIRRIDAQPGHGAERVDSEVEAEALTVGDA
jgi:predicted MFS family arabinose efflux permease